MGLPDSSDALFSHALPSSTPPWAITPSWGCVSGPLPDCCWGTERAHHQQTFVGNGLAESVRSKVDDVRETLERK